MSEKALTYFEVDIDTCSLTYGVAPCTATLTGGSPTGEIKCFNCLTTCQDRPNFTNVPVTQRFSKPADYLPLSIDALPYIESVRFTPAVISLGKDLGTRATLEVTFNDYPHSDTGPAGDKYRTERPHDPYKLGTYFGKYAARHPYVQGRPSRLTRGFLGETLGEMQTDHFVQESFDGPNAANQFKLISKDILKLADGDRAQAPKLSRGKLAGTIAAGALAATLAVTGIGNAEYASTGEVNIAGNEICAFTRSGDALTITRGQDGTTAVSHDAEDRVQQVLRYVSQDPGDIIRDLFVNFAGIPDSVIPIDDWNLETSTYLRRFYGAVIAEPTSVNKLVSEIIAQAGLAIWWDPENQLIRLLVLRVVNTDAIILDDDVILEGSLDPKRQPDIRLSQVWVYHGQRNPLKPLDDLENYRSVAAPIDLDAESPDEYGSAKILKIPSRWIPFGGLTIAQKLADTVLARFRDPPRNIKLRVKRRGAVTPVLGGGYKISSSNFQDATGARVTVPGQVTSLETLEGHMAVRLEEVLYKAPAGLDDLTVTITSDAFNVNLRDLYDQIYLPPESGDKVVCIIQSGVTVGSTSTSTYAFDVGDWQAGVEIILHVLGRVQGKGGKGGKGGDAPGSNNLFDGFPGNAGGPAFITTVPIKLDLSQGEFWSGGGGGGGGEPRDTTFLGGGGGGGGAGTQAGSGASGGQVQGSGEFAPSGQAGNSETGGNGGLGFASLAIPSNKSGDGGDGGDPGEDGQAGKIGDINAPGIGPGAGGPKGTAINGISLIELGEYDGTDFTPGETMTEDIRGPEIN